MDQLDEGREQLPARTSVITVTIGDLISAIADAAEEAAIGHEHISDLTTVVFQDMFRRRK